MKVDVVAGECNSDYVHQEKCICCHTLQSSENELISVHVKMHDRLLFTEAYGNEKTKFFVKSKGS